MAERSLRTIDETLSLEVKARDSCIKQITQLWDAAVLHTRRIDQLLAERSEVCFTVPDDLAGLALPAPPTPKDR